MLVKRVASGLIPSSLAISKSVTLGHTNLNFCFMSRIARKSDPVGRSIFVNVMYKSHHKIVISSNSSGTLSNSKPNVSSVVVSKTIGDTSTTVSRFISALIHSWSAISQNKILTMQHAQPQYQEGLARQLATYMESKSTCAVLNHTHKFTFYKNVNFYICPSFLCTSLP